MCINCLLCSLIVVVFFCVHVYYFLFDKYHQKICLLLSTLNLHNEFLLCPVNIMRSDFPQLFRTSKIFHTTQNTTINPLPPPRIMIQRGYEPACLTVHSTPSYCPKRSRVGSFLAWVSNATKKIPKQKVDFVGDIKS